MPNGVALTGYIGPMGLTCGANGGLNVNILTGGGGNGGGGSSSGAVYGPDATGAAPTKPPLFIGGVDPNGNIVPFTFTAKGLQFFDQATELALGSISDPAATVTSGVVGNGSTIAQLRAAVNQVAAVLAQIKTGTNVLQGGQPNTATNQLFEQTVGPSMQAPGTASSIARAVQRPDGKNVLTAGDPVAPVPVSYQLLANASATGTAQTVNGGSYLLDLRGTFGGAAVTINATVNGNTAALGSYTATPATPPSFTVATGTSIQAVVSGGSPSGLNATLGGIGSGSSVSSGPTVIQSTSGTITNPTDVTASAGAVTTLLSTTSRKYLSITNTGTGSCRVAYSGITPTASRGDPLNAASTSGLGGGSRTFEASYVPQGTVAVWCTNASAFSVLEGN